MEYYADLELHLQFVCLFRNESLYIDRSNEQNYRLLTSKPTIISLAKCYHRHKLYLIGFYLGKLQQSKVTNKTITNSKLYQK